MEEHEKGREAFADDSAYKLHALRHSAAHVMAEAIGVVFPEAAFAVGPPIKDGFFYDVSVARPITEEDLAVIEAQMKKVVKRNSRFERRSLTRDEAVELFSGLNQRFKVERVSMLGEDEEITVYDQGGFTDLCRGPHAPRTKNCKHFKLLKVSGAYLHGDSKNEQLQRIYGTVWPTRAALDQHLFRLEEAKKRDHRKIGARMGLFMFHDYAPGAPFWLPKGEWLYNRLSVSMRELLLGEGYVAVRTPMLFDKALWETSGHWDNYDDAMFHFHEGGGSAPSAEAQAAGQEGRVVGLKPMNCPSHMLIYGATRRSYRELPLRIHDQGVLHRNELRGTLSGLTRVRQFCQDDAHIFCTEDQIQEEVATLLTLVRRLYEAFGLGFNVKLSTRPEKRVGADALWDQAEAGLRGALDTAGMEYELKPGDGAFYGPKIDFDVLDALERDWQCATIQLDFNLPRRFKLKYIGADNAAHTPVVIHRAILGSFERFIGVLIEHFAGSFPTWLAPEAVRVMTVSEKSEAHGRAVFAALRAAGVPATLDERGEKIGRKIRECHHDRIPYMAIIGEKEQENGGVSIRCRDDADSGGAFTLDAFLARLAEESRVPFLDA